MNSDSVEKSVASAVEGETKQPTLPPEIIEYLALVKDQPSVRFAIAEILKLSPSVEGWIATEESEFLIPSFLAAINDIGRYGFEKYKDQSFQARRISGDASRGDMERTLPHTISLHAIEHFEMYLRGEIHDHFHTLKHQLAAVAFNAMMEYYFAGFDVAVPPLVPTSSGTDTGVNADSSEAGRIATAGEADRRKSESLKPAVPDSPIEPVGARERMYQILNRHREWPVFSPSQLRAMEIMITEFASSREEAVRELLTEMIKDMNDAIDGDSRFDVTITRWIRQTELALAKVKGEL